jgi:drug/metabolite transporter (DMT)-like permease
VVFGEIANFAAYAFAPPIMVTPLGALSVLIGAVLGAYFLSERLGLLGKIGCSTCLLGAIIIVLHAPPDKPVETIEQVLDYAIQPLFLLYCAIVAVFATVMIYRVAPSHGRRNPLVYISICSTVGSVSIMAVKGFGIAVKLTFAGNNQFTHPSTYVFMIVVTVCILTQMNYFNKALSQFSTNIVNPLYYVSFTTFTLLASFLMFRGFNTSDAVNTISLLCGFLVTFSGVYLLNLSREDPDGRTLLGAPGPLEMHGEFEEGLPTDSMGMWGTRRSMQLRRSSNEQTAGVRLGSDRHSRTHSWGSQTTSARNSLGDREGLMNGFGLGDLAEEEDDDADGVLQRSKKPGDEESGDLLANGHGQRRTGSQPGTPVVGAQTAANRLSGSGRARVERENVRPNKGGGS